MFDKPQLELDVYDIPKDFKQKYWNIFKKHHYLGDKLNTSARCWVAYLWGNPFRCLQFCFGYAKRIIEAGMEGTSSCCSF